MIKNSIINKIILPPMAVMFFLVFIMPSKSKAAEVRSNVISFGGKAYSLTFSDDFDFFDDTKWAYLPEIERADVGGVWRDSCSSVRDGNYVITCSTSEDGTPISGGIRSTGKYEQTRGLYHIRFKVEKADGLWYAFWLLTDKMNDDSVGCGATDGAELDIFEIVPNTREFCMSVHWDGYGDALKSRFETDYIDDDFYDRYHDAWYVWDEKGYRLYLDGTDEAHCRFRFSGKEYGEGTCAVPCDMIISAEYGKWGGEVNKSMLPAHFYVDSVEVYSEIKDVSINEKGFKSGAYGVYIGQDDFKKLKKKARNKKTIVIEGQSFTKKQIKALKKGGRKVYSYLNVGSVETYRPYFKQFKDYCLKQYEHWEDEYWIDVSKKKWQDFIVDTLAKNLIKKGVDGFFIDNCDVYYHYSTEDIYDGLRSIMQRLNSYGVDLIINGGDTFVSHLIKDGEQALISGVNQETVLSRIIDYDKDIFGSQKKSETKYFKSYLSKVKKSRLKVFLLEYTRNKKLKKKIKAYCKKNKFRYYISGSIKLG